MGSYNENKKSFFDKIEDGLTDYIKGDLEQAKEALKFEGLDPNYEITDGRKLINKFAFRYKAKHNKEKDQNLIDLAVIKLKEVFEKNRELAGRELSKLLGEKTPAYQFRNLEKLSDDELREVLEEVDLIKLIENLEENKKS